MSTTTNPTTTSSVRWLDDDEARAEFDAQIRRWLGLSGDEFLRRWDAGDYRGIEDDVDHPDVMNAVSLISLVRP